MASQEQKPGFTVTDRRSFAEGAQEEARGDDNLRTGGGEPPAEPSSGAPRNRPLPPVDFSTFVLSLGSSALMHLGEVENPEVGGAGEDLPLAKHSIDILSMLQSRTKGNLSADEEKLLESLLYDLRLRYVNAAKRPG